MLTLFLVVFASFSFFWSPSLLFSLFFLRQRYFPVCRLPCFFFPSPVFLFSLGKAFAWAFLSGMSEPLGGLLGWLVLRNLVGPVTFAVLFGLIAGVMARGPEAERQKREKKAAAGLAWGWRWFLSFRLVLSFVQLAGVQTVSSCCFLFLSWLDSGQVSTLWPRKVVVTPIID